MNGDDFLYRLYQASIRNKVLFCKKFLTLPEEKDMPDILENFGMHRVFKTACNIAKITDPLIQENLLTSITNAELGQGRVIHMNSLSPVKIAQ